MSFLSKKGEKRHFERLFVPKNPKNLRSHRFDTGNEKFGCRRDF